MAGLLEHCPMFRTLPGAGTGLALPQPAPIVSGEVQALQKGSLTGVTVALDEVQGDITSYAASTDLSLQASDDGARPAVDQVLMASANTGIIGFVDTAAGSLTKAIATVVGAYGPDILIVAPVGTAELADAAVGPVIVDPTATAMYVIAAHGVSAQVSNPEPSEAPNPSLLGTDIAYAVHLLGPVFGTNAVASVAIA